MAVLKIIEHIFAVVGIGATIYFIIGLKMWLDSIVGKDPNDEQY